MIEPASARQGDPPATMTDPTVPQTLSPAVRQCRNCGAPLERLFVDLGMSPPCEDFLTEDRLQGPETFYPLDVRICDRCLLVQLPAYVSPEAIFTEYAYFSSYSDSWVAHAARLVDEGVRRQGLDRDSRVIEVASNDGYLLQHVVARGIPALGIEPAGNIARVAEAKGIPTLNEFFSTSLAERIAATSGPADFVVANNVFAHIPDLNDFTAGLATILRPGGLLSIEVAYLVRLIERNEFDTVYHEHFMYYTVLSADAVLARHGLRILDVDELETHGGSIRLWVVHADDPRASSDRVEDMKNRERAAGYGSPEGYGGFAARVEATKRDLLEFLIEERRHGSRIAGYGAPGKGNTLLNYCGIRTDLVEFLVDRNPYKHGRYTPGTHIPIFAPEHLADARPDVILIMPWNLRDEIAGQLAYARAWGARLVVAIPELELVE
jgi:SAM-dependent methyltransferase